MLELKDNLNSGIILCEVFRTQILSSQIIRYNISCKYNVMIQFHAYL